MFLLNLFLLWNFIIEMKFAEIDLKDTYQQFLATTSPIL
jgi:hypothetical protein